jgi:hypothetical protein
MAGSSLGVVAACLAVIKKGEDGAVAASFMVKGFGPADCCARAARR